MTSFRYHLRTLRRTSSPSDCSTSDQTRPMSLKFNAKLWEKRTLATGVTGVRMLRHGHQRKVSILQVHSARFPRYTHNNPEGSGHHIGLSAPVSFVCALQGFYQRGGKNNRYEIFYPISNFFFNPKGVQLGSCLLLIVW